MLCIKEIKQILREAREACLKYIRLRDKARSYERRLMDGRAVNYKTDGGTRERNDNSMELSLCVAADYQAEADKAKRNFREPYIKARGIIYLAKDDVLCEVLKQYYLKGLSWEKVVKTLGYSERHVRRLHDKALREISKNT